MEDKLEMMSELVGDGCNTVNPATYCDISNVGADKVSYCHLASDMMEIFH